MEQRAPTLYDDVRRRLALARAHIDDLEASDEVRAALHERLTRYQSAARSDLTRASRSVDRLLEELGIARPVLHVH